MQSQLEFQAPRRQQTLKGQRENAGGVLFTEPLLRIQSAGGSLHTPVMHSIEFEVTKHCASPRIIWAGHELRFSCLFSRFSLLTSLFGHHCTPLLRPTASEGTHPSSPLSLRLWILRDCQTQRQGRDIRSGGAHGTYQKLLVVPHFTPTTWTERVKYIRPLKSSTVTGYCGIFLDYRLVLRIGP